MERPIDYRHRCCIVGPPSQCIHAGVTSGRIQRANALAFADMRGGQIWSAIEIQDTKIKRSIYHLVLDKPNALFLRHQSASSQKLSQRRTNICLWRQPVRNTAHSWNLWKLTRSCQPNINSMTYMNCPNPSSLQCDAITPLLMLVTRSIFRGGANSNAPTFPLILILPKRLRRLI